MLLMEVQEKMKIPILLQKALDEVKELAKGKEIETEIINLYDLNYTGCKSCFACKRL